jgi:hypothetical protein
MKEHASDSSALRHGLSAGQVRIRIIAIAKVPCYLGLMSAGCLEKGKV